MNKRKTGRKEKMGKCIKNGSVVFVLLALLLIISLAPLAYAQKTIKLRFNEIDDVIENTIFKWYSVDDGGKLNDTHKTKRMIIDSIVFFMIFAAMIFFSLKTWIGDKSKGALAVLTIGLGFGLSLALVTRTKYGSLSIFFPLARNLLTLLLFFGLYKLCRATLIKDNAFWAVVVAILLTRLMVGWWGIYTCDPATQDCGASMFVKSAGGSGEVREWSSACSKLLEQIDKDLADGTALKNEGDKFYNDKNYEEAIKKYEEAIVIFDRGLKNAEMIQKNQCLANTDDIIKKAKELVNKLSELIRRITEKKGEISGEGGVVVQDGWKSMTPGTSKCKAYVEQEKRWNPAGWACIATTNRNTCKKSVVAPGHSLCGSGLYCAVGPCTGTTTKEETVAPVGRDCSKLGKSELDKIKNCGVAIRNNLAAGGSAAETKELSRSAGCTAFCDCSRASLGASSNILGYC